MASSTSQAVGVDSLEYKTLKQCYPDLALCIQQAPNEIVDHLIPLGILTKRVEEFVQNPHNSDSDKARRIVDVVLYQVQCTTEVYEGFIAALKQNKWTTAAVRKVEETQRLLSILAVSEQRPQEERHTGE